MTGRPPILDPEKRQRLLSLLSVGCSRRIAAHYVGCSPSTITRTAGRDPAFADQVAQAESNLEIELLGAIRHAARNDRYWRAAAWLLERKNPQDFQKRPEQTFSPDQVTQLFAVVLDSLRGQLPAEQINLALHHLSTLLGEFDPNKTTTPQPTSAPPTPDPSTPEPSTPPLSALRFPPLPPTDPTNPWVAHSERERWVWIAESPRPSLRL